MEDEEFKKQLALSTYQVMKAMAEMAQKFLDEHPKLEDSDLTTKQG